MKIEPPLITLAPMAGITDWPTRLLCCEQGCNGTTTEMVSAMGYLTAPRQSAVYRHLLAVHPHEPKPAVQIFGHEPALMAQAAARLSESGRFRAVDINMGCPAQKVTSSGSGSALMKDLSLCREIIAAVCRASSLPVTIKMRLGWDEAHKNAVELARIAEDLGVSLLTVHGRTRAQQYAGHADWQAVAEVKRAVAIPVLLNGDVASPQDAVEALRQTGCDGVAIGRGALGNPFLFSQIAAALRGESLSAPSPDVWVQTAIRHGEMMRAWKGERAAVLEMRKHMCWYIRGCRGAAQLRTRLTAAPDLNEVFSLLRDFAASLPS